MELSVIIPTYNRARSLGVTVRSLLRDQLAAASYEVIVVDNGSSDDTAAVVRALAAESEVPVRYLRETRPGVHFARNHGALYARGAILYYTDDDMIASPGMLPTLLRLFMLDPAIGTATGRVLPKWEREPPAWILEHCQNALLSLQTRNEDLIISGDDVGVYSCHQGIRRDVLLECGGFNPENTGGTWVGDGETGLCIKLRTRGHKFAYTAAAVTQHVIPAERMTQEYLRRRMANQASADSYTWYRAARPGAGAMVSDQLRNLFRCGYEALKAARNSVLGRTAWRMNLARVAYHRARFAYVGRLRRDDSWRTFVLRDDWIDRDGTEPAAA